MLRRAAVLSAAVAGLVIAVAVGGVAVVAAKPDERPAVEKLLDETDAITDMVVKLRGLPLKKKIKRGVMSKDQVRARILQRIDEELAPALIKGEELTLKRFGMFPADKDYKQTVIALLTDQIAGFYDPKTQELYIADWIGMEMQRPVLAHEIDHALQDQSFNLSKLMKPIADNGDEQLARQALIEGDGLAVMIEFSLAEMNVKQDPWAEPAMTKMLSNSVRQGALGEMKDAPLVLRESLIFPYLGGLELVAYTRRHHPWSAVDKMFKKLPVSTEQIIHPEKYFAGEKPIKVKTGALKALKGHREMYVNVLGELGFSLLFRQHGLADAQAEAAAAGWGGDRYHVYAPKGEGDPALATVFVVVRSVWDVEMDAIEAFDALGTVLAALTKDTSCTREGQVVRCKDATGAVSLVERRESELLLVVGAPADLVVGVTDESWKRWKSAK